MNMETQDGYRTYRKWLAAHPADEYMLKLYPGVQKVNASEQKVWAAKVVMGCLVLAGLLVGIVALASGHEDNERDELRFNLWENRYEWAKPSDNLRYNLWDDTQSYESDDAVLRYNLFEDRYEWVE